MKYLFPIFLFFLCSQVKAQTVEGHYVRLELSNNYLHVAEVEVYSGGKNVALKKKASQSTNPFKLKPDFAVDGNTDGNGSHGSIIHTGNGDKEWWEVDLGDDYPIDSIVIYNRTDNPGVALPRIIGCAVRVLNAQRDQVWSKKITEGLEKYTFKLGDSAQSPGASANQSTKDPAPRMIVLL